MPVDFAAVGVYTLRGRPMIDLFLKGGLLMYPLLACSLISLAVIIEKSVQFARVRSDRARIEAVLKAASVRDWVEGESLVRRDTTPLGRLMAAALAGRTVPRSDLENRLSRLGSLELKHLSRRLHLLELVGRISPMLGLTGTVTGLTRAFQTVAALKQVSDPGLLAGGIWEALITTVAGLFIGIPTIVAYHLLDNRLKSVAFEMKSVGEELVARITEGA
jgi:biopolymer transport protein ExbB